MAFSLREQLSASCLILNLGRLGACLTGKVNARVAGTKYYVNVSVDATWDWLIKFLNLASVL